MPSLGLILAIIFFLFIATFVRSTLGFGDGLIAMPLLALLLDLQTTTPLVALVSGSVTLIIVGESWRSIDLRGVWRLIAGSLVGIPLGLFLLTNAPEELIKSILGVILILFGLYNLTQPTLPYLKQQGWSYGCGLLGGLFGGAYNMAGPPVIIYGMLRHWSPGYFRAMLQGYFLPLAILVISGHGLAGLWTTKVLTLFGLSLPSVLLAVFLGSRLNRRIPVERFSRVVYVILIILGILLLW